MTPKQKQEHIVQLKNIIKNNGFIEDRYGNFVQDFGHSKYRFVFKRIVWRLEHKMDFGWFNALSEVISKTNLDEFNQYLKARVKANKENTEIVEITEIKGDTEMTTETKTNNFMETLKDMIKTNSGITQKDLITMTGKASSTVRSYLNKLRDENLIIKGFDDDNRMTIIWVGDEELTTDTIDTKEEVTTKTTQEPKPEVIEEKEEVETEIEDHIEEAIETNNTRKETVKGQMYVVFFQVKEELKKTLDNFNNEPIEKRPVNLANDFKKVMTIEADSKEHAFSMMQSGNIDDSIFKSLGLVHTSMCAGDILMDEAGNLFRMTASGWLKVKDGQVPKKPGKAKKTKKTGKSGAHKNPGIIQVIIDSLENPMSKEELLETLIEKFPDREADKMKKTINCQVPYRLRTDKGIVLKKDKDGRYFIVKE